MGVVNDRAIICFGFEWSSNRVHDPTGWTTTPAKRLQLLGRCILVDPDICHGKPTFVGTRIMVAQVLKQVARGVAWDAIIAEGRGAVTRDAIAESIEVAQRIFEDHAVESARAIAHVNVLDEHSTEIALHPNNRRRAASSPPAVTQRVGIRSPLAGGGGQAAPVQ